MADDDAAAESTDETKPEVVDPGKAAADATAAALANAATKADVAKIEQTVSALADTVRAVLSRPPSAPTGGSPDAPDLPANFINRLRQMGLSDADIKHNAPIIVPFLRTMLETDGAQITGAIVQVQDEVEMVKARGNKKLFPDWEHVEERVSELREEARKNGRYLTPKDAYNAAVAADIGSPDSKIAEARARLKARSASDDVSAQNLTHQSSASRTTSGLLNSTALTAAQLADLSPKERKAYFEKVGDLPIR